VIDDEEAVRLPLRAALEMAGHQVREASDGGGGLAEQQASPADLVITDLRMPGMAGHELIQRLKADFPATRVIAISAVDEDLGDRWGVDGVIKKPFALKDVLARVADLLP
jgi:DNA-binding response OmpR family regulator